MGKWKDLLETISPVLLKASSGSLTLSVSKRFFIFKTMQKLFNVIDEDPHLNFLALLKNYKVLGKFLHGTLAEFHRDRNKSYFKNFFYDKELYALVKADLEELYPDHKKVHMTITKRGLVTYHNYKKNKFNVLLMTIHAGTWAPKSISDKMSFDDKFRYSEEDVASDKLYRKLVLEKGGIWIDNKQSRFVIDFNRPEERAVYLDHSEKWLEGVWKEPLSKYENEIVHKSHQEFYFLVSQLVEAYTFNIIFDGHTMKHRPGRPNISFGTKYIPHFYMPIVLSMQRTLKKMGYTNVALNKPYAGGYILKYLSEKYPNRFIFSMEINKNMYMTKNRMKVKKREIERLAKNLPQIFDLELHDDEGN